MGKALSGSGWPAEEHAGSMAIENGVRLRVSALLKTITSFLDLEVAELVRWQNWGRRRDSSLCLLTSFESDDAF